MTEIEITNPIIPVYTYRIEKLKTGKYLAGIRTPEWLTLTANYPGVDEGFSSSHEADLAVREWAKDRGFKLVRTL